MSFVMVFLTFQSYLLGNLGTPHQVMASRPCASLDNRHPTLYHRTPILRREPSRGLVMSLHCHCDKTHPPPLRFRMSPDRSTTRRRTDTWRPDDFQYASIAVSLSPFTTPVGDASTTSLTAGAATSFVGAILMNFLPKSIRWLHVMIPPAATIPPLAARHHLSAVNRHLPMVETGHIMSNY